MGVEVSEILCEKPRIELYQGDCLEVMKQIPDKSVDLVLADPPYNTGMKATNNKARLCYFFNDNFTPEEYIKLVRGG
jgi:site-specific DNA-methyltransferase (adenine-specific)